MKTFIYRLKKRFQDFKINFKKKVKEYKKPPKSKRKSFMIGFGISAGIFGLTLFVPSLSAMAKDTLPKRTPNPTEIAPASNNVPSIPPNTELINNGLSSFAGMVCGLVVTSESFAVGRAFGFIVVIGILQIQGK